MLVDAITKSAICGIMLAGDVGAVWELISAWIDFTLKFQSR